MATTALIPLAEYLQTTYRPDREYLDGELLERNAGKWEHSRVQSMLSGWFDSQETLWGVTSATEQRLQVSPTRVRIPDVLLIPSGLPPDVLTEPPILVVEILSPEDTYSDTQQRASDYLNMGVKTVWIIDPNSRTGRSCIGNTWTASDRLEVPETPIYVDLRNLFERLSVSRP